MKVIVDLSKIKKDKGFDEEEYISFPMHREKAVGVSFSEESMEVASEL